VDQLTVQMGMQISLRTKEFQSTHGLWQKNNLKRRQRFETEKATITININQRNQKEAVRGGWRGPNHRKGGGDSVIKKFNWAGEH